MHLLMHVGLLLFSRIWSFNWNHQKSGVAMALQLSLVRILRFQPKKNIEADMHFVGERTAKSLVSSSKDLSQRSRFLSIESKRTSESSVWGLLLQMMLRRRRTTVEGFKTKMKIKRRHSWKGRSKRWRPSYLLHQTIYFQNRELHAFSPYYLNLKSFESKNIYLNPLMSLDSDISWFNQPDEAKERGQSTVCNAFM